MRTHKDLNGRRLAGFMGAVERMGVEEFDKFADEYYSKHADNIRITGEMPEYFARYKVADLVRMHPNLTAKSTFILDFGAGVGSSVPFLLEFFPNALLSCVDVSPRSLEIGQKRFPTAAKFKLFDGYHLPYDSRAFDLVFAACVFHHIPKNRHADILAEILRVLKPGGLFAVYEHNPLNPLTRRAVRTCAFDENVALIRVGRLTAAIKAAGFVSIKRAFRLFFPRALRFLRPLEPHLGWCPLGAQYVVSAGAPSRG